MILTFNFLLLLNTPFISSHLVAIPRPYRQSVDNMNKNGFLLINVIVTKKVILFRSTYNLPIVAIHHFVVSGNISSIN